MEAKAGVCVIVDVVPASHEDIAEDPLVVASYRLNTKGAYCIAVHTNNDDVVVRRDLEPVVAEVETEFGQLRLL